MEDAHEQGRRKAFGRFVERAVKRWLDQHPGQGMRELADFLGSSTPTLYRWINGTWKKDPSRDSVDKFCSKMRIDPQIAYNFLGWGKDAPERSATPPMMDPDVEDLLRTLEDPLVPAARKEHIREMVRFLSRRPPPGSTRDTGT